MRRGLVSVLTWEDIKEIIQVSDSLLTGTAWDQITYPSEEDFYRASLDKLRRVNGEKMPCDERCAYIIGVAEEVTGHKLDGSRSEANTLVRRFAALRLDQEGYGRTEVGRAMKKNHATVLNLCQKMNDILSLPNLYKRENALYSEFEMRLGGPVPKEES